MINSNGSKARPTRRRWALAGLVVVVLAAALFHRPLLWGVARLLVVDDVPLASDYVVVLGSLAAESSCYVTAAGLVERRLARGVLLVEPWPMRPVQYGVVPGFETIARRELTRRGVPADAIELAEGASLDAWQEARQIQRWLRGRPDTRLIVPCDRFHGSYRRRVMNVVFGNDDSTRLVLVALPDDFVNETNWWTSRVGIQEVFSAYARLAFNICHGETALVVEPWKVEDYERTLRQMEKKP